MLYSYPTLSVSHLRALRDILAQKVFGILPVEEAKGDKSFTVYADGSYKAEMPINYKISLAKRPVLLLEKDVQARANHYLDALKDIKDKSVIKNLGGISLLPDGVVIDRIEKAFPEDSKGEGWYWTVACVLKLRPSSEEDAIIVQGAGVQIDIASTGNIMRLHSTVLPIMQPKKDEGFEILDLSDLSSNNIFREDNNQLQARGGTVNSVQNIILPKLKPLLFKHNASNGTYSPFTTTNEGDKALTRWGVKEKEEVMSEEDAEDLEDTISDDDIKGVAIMLHEVLPKSDYTIALSLLMKLNFDSKAIEKLKVEYRELTKLELKDSLLEMSDNYRQLALELIADAGIKEEERLITKESSPQKSANRMSELIETNGSIQQIWGILISQGLNNGVDGLIKLRNKLSNKSKKEDISFEQMITGRAGLTPNEIFFSLYLLYILEMPSLSTTLQLPAIETTPPVNLGIGAVRGYVDDMTASIPYKAINRTEYPRRDENGVLVRDNNGRAIYDTKTEELDILFLVGYTGALSSNMRWLQVIYRQKSTYKIENGLVVEKKEEGLVPGKNYEYTKDPLKPIYVIDGQPFFEGFLDGTYLTAVRTNDSIIMFDKPTIIPESDAVLIDEGKLTRVVSKFHAYQFLVMDFYVLGYFEVSIEGDDKGKDDKGKKKDELNISIKAWKSCDGYALPVLPGADNIDILKDYKTHAFIRRL